MAYLLALVGHECQQLKRAIFAIQEGRAVAEEKFSTLKGETRRGWRAEMPRVSAGVVGAVGIEPTTSPV